MPLCCHSFSSLCSSCDSLGRLEREVWQWRAEQTNSSQIKLRPRRLRTGPPTSTRYESLPTEEGVMVRTGIILWKHTGVYCTVEIMPCVFHHPSIWWRVIFSESLTNRNHCTPCNMKIEVEQHCRWNLFSKEKTLITLCFLSDPVRLKCVDKVITITQFSFSAWSNRVWVVTVQSQSIIHIYI